MEQHSSVDHPILKIATAWLAAFGIASWSDLAAALAAIYSVLLICEWLWKKCGRAFAERHGIVKPRLRRASDK